MGVLFSDHALDKLVDVLLTVSAVASLDKVASLGVVSSAGGREGEGPEETVGLLEVGSNGEDLVDQILNANDSLGSKTILDDLVAGDGKALSLDLGESTLVDEVRDGLLGGVSVGNVGLDEAEHLDDGSVQAEEHGVVQTTETEETKDLLGAGVNSENTVDHRLWRQQPLLSPTLRRRKSRKKKKKVSTKEGQRRGEGKRTHEFW